MLLKDSQSGVADQNRWDPWVNFAWVLVGLSVIGSGFFIAKFGMTSIPGSTSSPILAQQVFAANAMVWALCIAELVFVVMAAVLFSMMNNIYKNSCGNSSTTSDRSSDEKVHGSVGKSVKSSYSAAEDKRAAASGAEDEGVLIVSFDKGSPLSGRLRDGYRVTKVNGVSVSSEVDMNEAATNGKNYLEVKSPNGHVSQFVVKLKGDGFKINGVV